MRALFAFLRRFRSAAGGRARQRHWPTHTRTARARGPTASAGRKGEGKEEHRPRTFFPALFLFSAADSALLFSLSESGYVFSLSSALTLSLPLSLPLLSARVGQGEPQAAGAGREEKGETKRRDKQRADEKASVLPFAFLSSLCKGPCDSVQLRAVIFAHRGCLLRRRTKRGSEGRGRRLCAKTGLVRSGRWSGKERERGREEREER